MQRVYQGPLCVCVCVCVYICVLYVLSLPEASPAKSNGRVENPFGLPAQADPLLCWLECGQAPTYLTRRHLSICLVSSLLLVQVDGQLPAAPVLVATIS